MEASDTVVLIDEATFLYNVLLLRMHYLLLHCIIKVNGSFSANHRLW